MRDFASFMKEVGIGDVHVAGADWPREAKRGRRRGRRRIPQIGGFIGQTPTAKRLPAELMEGEGGRKLEPFARGYAKNPFPVHREAMGQIRPDQVPRFLEALTHPDRLDKRKMKFSELTAIQDRVDPHKVQAIREKSHKPKHPPIVVRFGTPARNYIVDGDHHLASKWLDGKDRAKVLFLNITPRTEAMKNFVPGSLYVKRVLKNADDLIAWAKANGFETTYKPEDMHVTIAYSKSTVDVAKAGAAPDELVIPAGGKRTVKILGDEGAVVLRFKSDDLKARWKSFRDAGADWSHDKYRPHVTISLKGDVPPAASLAPYDGPLVFGPEVHGQVKENWAAGVTEKSWETTFKVEKTNADKRWIFGWFSNVTKDGAMILDKQGDKIPVAELENAVYEFNLFARQHGHMHKDMGTGRLIESMVFTKEKQDALGIIIRENPEDPMSAQIEGWWGGFFVDNPEVWKAIKRGELPEFSIGGTAVPVDVAA